MPAAVRPTQPPPRRVPWRLMLLTMLVVAGGICFWAKGRGYKTAAFRFVNPDYDVHHYPIALQPSVIRTRPADREANVLPIHAFIAADVELPYNGKVVDGNSLNSDSVRLYRSDDHRAVPAVVNTSGAGDAIVLRPTQTLDPTTQYTFEVTAGAKDTAGHSFRPYTATFWTAAGQQVCDFPAAFEKVAMPMAGSYMFTCVTIGPDHRLYASSLAGHIFRYNLNTDGTIQDVEQINTVNQANGKVRLITGITFDPASTPEHLSLWVSHGDLPSQGEKGQAWIRGAQDWTGKISRLDGPNLSEYHDVVVGLPRAWKDHLNNQIAFGPDGAMYFCQAANTAMGAPDHKWGFRPERLLSAAILRVDVKALNRWDHPLDVKTEDGGHYDPFAPGAPLTIYASGIRNSYDLVWHSNGHLYGGINGSAAGGNTPASPASGIEKLPRLDSALRGNYDAPAVSALTNVADTEDDVLLKIEPGGYYGHPNPTRAEYVLNAGHVSNTETALQTTQYPLGTHPDRNYRPPIFTFGKNLSPCGGIEYQSDTFNGVLKGKLLFVRYSGGDDIQALTLDARGEVAESITGIEGFGRFVNPVDLTEDTDTGCIYVAEFGGKRITLLRPILPTAPVADAVSHHVCRVQTRPVTLTSGQE